MNILISWGKTKIDLEKLFLYIFFTLKSSRAAVTRLLAFFGGMGVSFRKEGGSLEFEGGSLSAIVISRLQHGFRRSSVYTYPEAHPERFPRFCGHTVAVHVPSISDGRPKGRRKKKRLGVAWAEHEPCFRGRYACGSGDCMSMSKRSDTLSSRSALRHARFLPRGYYQPLSFSHTFLRDRIFENVSRYKE